MREAFSWVKPIPRAVSGRFTIAVLHLEGDEGHAIERLIRESLIEFEGVNILAISRTIRLRGPDLSASKRANEDQARRFLQSTGASMLIWGSVVSHNGKSVPKLYLATAKGQLMFLKTGRYVPTDDVLELPVAFWSDLKAVLRPFIALSVAEFSRSGKMTSGKQGRELFESVEALLSEASSSKGWSARDRADLCVLYATIMTSFADAFGDKALLWRAATGIQKSLERMSKEADRARYADLQHAQGVIFYQIAERESSLESVQKAKSLALESLKGRTHEDNPVKWAAAKFSLGNVLYLHGERTGNGESLLEGVAALKDALSVFSRDRFPVDWAHCRMNLGATYNILAQHSSAWDNLSASISEYREALQVLTRDASPRMWAMVQNNLGNSLRQVGVRSSQPGLLLESEVAYKESLKVFTKDETPVLFSRSNANLSATLVALGGIESRVERFEEAVSAARLAVGALTYEKEPFDWAYAQMTLAASLNALGWRTRNVATIQQAVAEYERMLKLVDPRKMPKHARRAQASAAEAYAGLGELTNNPSYLEKAVSVWRAVLGELKGFPREWMVVKGNMARALVALAQIKNDPVALCKAVEEYAEASMGPSHAKQRDQDQSLLATAQNVLALMAEVYGLDEVKKCERCLKKKGFEIAMARVGEGEGDSTGNQ